MSVHVSDGCKRVVDFQFISFFLFRISVWSSVFFHTRVKSEVSEFRVFFFFF
jgi:hypothetical protein